MKKQIELMNTAPTQIRDRFGPDAPIFGVARNSQASGTRGRQQAAQNAVMLLRSLAAQGVVDVVDQAPTEQGFIDLLEASKDIETVGSHRWTYATWVSRDRSVFVLVCQGSGRKVDERGIQPFMDRVRDTIMVLKPVAVWAFELDRLGRDELGLGQIVRAIDTISAAGSACWLGSGDRGLLPRYEGWDVGLYFEGRQSRTQADSLSRRTRATMIAKTEHEMRDGRCVFLLPTAPPAGLSHVRLRDNRGGKGDPIIFLDAPQFQPDASEVFEPLPRALQDDKTPASQVTNVQWALAQIADGRPALEIAQVLFARGYSNTQFRRTHGLDATYRSIHTTPTSKIANGLCRSLAHNIDFYESGVLAVNMADQTIEITNCMPDGGWINSDVAEGVRHWLIQRRRTSQLRSHTSLGGLSVTLDGVPRHLHLISRSCSCSTQGDGHEQ